MSRPTRPTLPVIAAASMLSASVVVLAACVTSDLAAPPDGFGVHLLAEPAWIYGLFAVIHAGLGAVVLVRGRGRRFGGWLVVSAAAWTLTAALRAYLRAGVSSDALGPLDVTLLWVVDLMTFQVVITTSALLLVFPTGRFLDGAWGRAGRVALAVEVASGVLITLGRAPLQMTPQLSEVVDRRTVAADPTVVEVLVGPVQTLLPALVAASFVAFGVAVATVVVRYLRARGGERDPLRWLLWSLVIQVLLSVFGVVIGAGQLGTTMTYPAVILPVVGMGLAIIDPTAVSIDELLAHTVVYGGLSVLILGADVAVLAGLTALLGDALHQQAVVLVVLLLSATIYGPLRLRLSAVVRRLLLGDRDSPYDVVAGLASSLETVGSGPAQLEAVATAVAAAFGIGFVSVEVDRGGGERLVATRGTRPARTRVLPITYRSSTVGRLVLPAGGARSRLSGRDERLLRDLVRQAATAVRTSRLADDLQESRERLVVAREEERRRIRRDLHDGLGPSLSGVVFQLDSVSLLVDTAPEAAKQQLAATSGHVQDVVRDVRRLVHDLRPPALDDRGLVGALTQQGERLAGSGVRVQVDPAELGALPAAVEVAAYRIAGEALTNVGRHAAAAHATVRFALADETLFVEVADDGVGIAAEAETGVGLLSLRERAAELGGRSDVSCPSTGGTVVRAWLPVRPPA